MPRKREDQEILQVALTVLELTELETLAAQFGLFWKGKPNKSALVSAIANHQIRLLPRQKTSTITSTSIYSEVELYAFLQALELLRIHRNIPTSVLNSLLSRPEIQSDRNLDQKLSILGLPATDNERKIDSYIKARQPFRIVNYHDVAGKIWEFTVLYADWWYTLDGKRRLRCWCSEGKDEGNLDIEALLHNWNFLPERIDAVTLVNQDWKESGLDWVTATLHFFEGMAYAYRPTPDDLQPGQLTSFNNETVLVVKRKVWSSFWLQKSLNSYLDVVAVVDPPALAMQYEANLIKALHRQQQSFLP